jgi:hypothetical protein
MASNFEIVPTKTVFTGDMHQMQSLLGGMTKCNILVRDGQCVTYKFKSSMYQYIILSQDYDEL